VAGRGVAQSSITRPGAGAGDTVVPAQGAGHGRATDVAAQPLELLALGRLNVDAGMQGEPARADRAVRSQFQPRQPGRHRLQREQSLSGSGADRDPVGDRMPDQVVERAGLEITSKPRVLDVALDQATTFQHLAHLCADLLDQPLQLVRAAPATGRLSGSGSGPSHGWPRCRAAPASPLRSDSEPMVTGRHLTRRRCASDASGLRVADGL